MESESKIVLATTTLATNKTDYQRVRAALALKTIFEAKAHNYNIVAVDGGSPSEYIDQMLELGAIVFPQEEPGMGNARRQALQLARETSENHTAIVWLEPEKSTLVPLIRKATDKVINEGNDMVMFRRRSLTSYPPEQAHTYKMVELAFKYLTNIKCDFLFGLVALSRNAVDYFLTYKSKYGDKWDSIHIPKLHIINDQLPWSQAPIEYRHPEEQTEAEQGNMDLFLKRVEQIRVVTQALVEEVNDLQKEKVDNQTIYERGNFSIQ